MTVDRIWLLLLVWASTGFANLANSTLGSPISPRDDGQWYYFGWVPRPGSASEDSISQKKSEGALSAYYEAVYLANVAYQTLHVEDPIFLRYFEVWDFDFIKGRTSLPLLLKATS